MSEIKAGTIVYHKVTEEPMFVLEVSGNYQTVSYPQLSGLVAKVRRPTVEKEGNVKHHIDYFTVEELETAEDGQNRKLAEMEELKARYNARQTDQPASVADELPLPN